jgi:predicted nucleic acid-binding protein
MIHLLDANVLIALGDADHPHRVAALRFFEKTATVQGWATCPLTAQVQNPSGRT